VALLLGAAAFAAYANSFRAPFVFDDEPSILGNPTIRNLRTAWWPPAGEGGLTVAGRPLLNFTFGLNYALSDTEVWSYHLVNLLIHCAAGCVLFGVVRRTLGLAAAPWREAAHGLALVVALLWLLHPLQTESVTYIVQRAESLAGLLYLLTLWCFIRAAEPGAPGRWAVGAVVACALGMAAKEVMVSAPVLVALYDRTFLAGSWVEVWRRRWRLHAALAATWLVLIGLVAANPGRGGSAGFGLGVAASDYALTQVGAVVHYLRLAVWPAPLVLDYGTALVRSPVDVLLPALLLGPLVAGTLWAVWRGRALGFVGAFFFAVLAPSSSFVPVVTQTMAEHRMYLPLAAVLVIVVLGGYRLAGRKVLWAGLVLAVVCGALTARRNADYATNIGLYEDIVAKRPGNARAIALLGDYYRRAGRLDEARRALERSLALEPQVPQVWNNLGSVWQELGEPARAATALERAVNLAPGNAIFLGNLGAALVATGRGEEGLARLREAVERAPESGGPRFNLASALAQAGRLEEAAAQFGILVAARPEDAAARDAYGQVLQSLGRGNEALAEMQAAVRLRPGDADLHNRLGIFLARSGRMQEALAAFQAALAIDPNHPSAAQNAALARQRLGRR
jgi:Flp pilus assembly protein TadD